MASPNRSAASRADDDGGGGDCPQLVLTARGTTAAPFQRAAHGAGSVDSVYLLAAELSIASIVALGSGAVLTVAAMMLLVRPINIWLCTWNSDLNWRQKLFLCWVAPRGIVSASVASLFAILLTERGINGGASIKAWFSLLFSRR